MELTIINKSKKIIKDGESYICDFTLSDNIDVIQWHGDKGFVEYNDKPFEKFTELTDMPQYNELLKAFKEGKKRHPPTKYHTWVGKEFIITPKNQAQKEADDAKRAREQQEREDEKTSNPLTNLTFKQASTWIDNNVTDLNSTKTALKKIVRLLLATRR